MPYLSLAFFLHALAMAEGQSMSLKHDAPLQSCMFQQFMSWRLLHSVHFSSSLLGESFLCFASRKNLSCCMQGAVMIANGFAILNNDRFLEKSKSFQANQKASWEALCLIIHLPRLWIAIECATHWSSVRLQAKITHIMLFLYSFCTSLSI